MSSTVMAEIATRASDSKTDVQGKNTQVICCTYCPSKILNPGAASLTNITYPLPLVLCKRDEVDKREIINEYCMRRL
ncbi:uncharacterized protein LOC106640090 isoform X2 [Copidosoma floridanum]|uniref:uncharacterized protein LOC106640090 isoform X2 n=1 Tax=Copidosoma floridanum TaxID=29053 RepID=UPI0006C95B98|nr:uncharacterized protein LOC106640090 isoform X2 [Copidosoma floridanum]